MAEKKNIFVDDLSCSGLISFDITPDMENPRAHLDFRYDFDLDEYWFKIVSNFDTVIAVCDKSHTSWKFASNCRKRKLVSELQEKLETSPQPKKGFLVVWNMTKDCVKKSVHHLASLLEQFFRERQIPLFGFVEVDVCSEEIMRQENLSLSCLEQVQKNLVMTTVCGADIDLFSNLKNGEVLRFVFFK